MLLFLCIKKGLCLNKPSLNKITKASHSRDKASPYMPEFIRGVFRLSVKLAAIYPLN